MENEGKNYVSFSELAHFTEKQKVAEQAVNDHKFVLYGGAMAGGKSYWLRWMLLKLLFFYYKKYRQKGVTVALFCEDYPTLKDRHLSKVSFEFPDWLGKYKSQEHNFVLNERFGSGVIAFRNLDEISKYKSSEFAAIAIDELTQNSEEIFVFLRTRLRWAGISDTKFLAGTNPGGIGHDWVKRRWIDREFPTYESERAQFYYVPALASDNPYISQSYLDSLKSLPENQRKAYLEGSWEVFEGQYFTEWDPKVHLVEPFEIPFNWAKFRTIDPSGKNGKTACLWIAIDFDGAAWVYREYYCQGKDVDEHARQIVELSVDAQGLPEKYRYTVIDAAAFAKIGMPETTAEVFLRNGVYDIIPSSKNRVMGWDFVHTYLRHDDINPPRLRFFNHCINTARTMPSLVHDNIRPEDVDSAGEDHIADALRYFLQTLREYKTAKPKSEAEKRLEYLKNIGEQDYNSFNY
jgi:hypothetical protein